MAAPPRLLAVTVALLALWHSTAHPPVGFAQSPDEKAELTRYRVIVEAYQAGRTIEAVEQLQTLGSKYPQIFADAARTGANATRSAATLDQPLFRVAAMLHTDAVQFLWTDHRPEALRHLDIARRWIDATERIPLPSGSFRRRWYLAAGLLLVERGLERGGLDPAQEHFALACRALPDEVPVLTAVAWLDERLALAPVPRDRTRESYLLIAKREKHVYLYEASSRLEAALAVDPLATEAALRLGRVRTLLGDRAGARRQLSPLVDRAELSAPDAYLARLFLGRLFEQDGDMARAEALYRDAAERVPFGQSARMAIAHLRYRAGEASRAADAIATILESAPNVDAGTAEDPWTNYLVGYLSLGPTLRADLRREVQR